MDILGIAILGMLGMVFAAMGRIAFFTIILVLIFSYGLGMIMTP